MALAPALAPHCNLTGRQLLMQILSPDGDLTTYTVGAPPSVIWRGQVLMRCGPAYGLDGQVRPGSAYQNRVVLDGLPQDFWAWSGCQLPTPERNAHLPVCWEQASGLVQWQMQLQLQLQLQRDGVSAQRDGQALLKG